MPAADRVTKSPGEILPIHIDWTDELAEVAPGQTITAVAHTVTGLTLASESFTATETTVTVSGGVADENYPITCQVTCSGGAVLEFGFWVRSRDATG